MMDYKHRTQGSWLCAITAVALMVAVCFTPMASYDSEAAATSGTYDIYLVKGQTWSSGFSYTETLTPTAYVLVSTTEITATSGSWSSGTTTTTEVTSGTNNNTSTFAKVSLTPSTHKVNVSVKIGSNYTTSSTAYVGVKLITQNPSQTALTVFKIHIVSPSFTTGYTGGSFYAGQTVSQTPVVSMGGGCNYKSVSYSITNESTLTATGLSFNKSTGAISGTVTTPDNKSTSYIVTATLVTLTGFPANQKISTEFSLGTYASANVAAESCYARTNTDSITVNAPTTTGITYVLQSASYTLNDGSSNTIATGTAFNGITVASAGSISGTPTVAGVYKITENFKISQTGQTVSRIVTVTVEDQVVISVKDTVNTYAGAATNSTLVTASHTEGNSVSGTWSISSGNTKGYFAIGSDGKITVKKTLATGSYPITVKYVSTKSTTNYATKNVTINVDAKLVLACTDEDKTLYAATDSKYLDNGQDTATIEQTAALYAGSKTVEYSISCTGLTSSQISINKSSGEITISDDLSSVTPGEYTATVTCKDTAVVANTATMTLTIVVVKGLSVSEPEVGTVSSS